ncbi:hypothetical protein D3C81_1415140 [compost metagenome]
MLGRIARARGSGAGADAGRQAGCTRQDAGAISGAAAKAQVAAVAVAQAVDTVVANFADQGQAAGAHHLVDELGGGDLRLDHGHALVAIDVAAGHRRRRRGYETGGNQR